jgi:hypothetical protein
VSVKYGEAEIEQEIQAKRLNAPRVAPAHLDAVIAGEQYHVFPGTTLTVCCLTLRNGFTVTGQSAAASPENFDAELGRKIARADARDKIWMLEGYLLREQLYQAALNNDYGRL